jgi:uncharacterized protein YecE (DUF72 family)
MRASVGTSGYGYEGWRGPFYPERLPAREWLRFYAERLPAVEINNTFYRMPRTSVLESWAAQVPSHFRFALKASRRITHFKRLADCADETAWLLRGAAALGGRLGAILFQLPPNLRCDLGRLDAFLALLPEGTPAAFEFRHPSWREAPVRDRLRARGCALVAADDDDGEPAPIEPTAGFGYLRLRRPGYQRADLAGWAQRILAQGWSEVFAFFKHEEAGTGPRLAAELLELLERAASRKGPVPARAARRRREAG